MPKSGAYSDAQHFQEGRGGPALLMDQCYSQQNLCNAKTRPGRSPGFRGNYFHPPPQQGGQTQHSHPTLPFSGRSHPASSPHSAACNADSIVASAVSRVSVEQVSLRWSSHVLSLFDARGKGKMKRDAAGKLAKLPSQHRHFLWLSAHWQRRCCHLHHRRGYHSLSRG